MRIEIPELAVVALIGVSSSGKSTFAKKYFKPTEILSSDYFRALISDDENNMDVTSQAFDTLYYVANKRLELGLLTVIDATNVQKEVYINSGGCFVLIEENESIQAMGALKIISEKVAEIKRMRVETSLQRQGLGQKILDYLILHAKKHGVERIILDTSELQEAAQYFYIKNGFIEYNRKKWNDIIIIFYEKFLIT